MRRPRGKSSWHAPCAAPTTGSHRTPTTMSSDCALILCSYRVESNDALALYSLDSDLEQRLGKWSSSQLDLLSSALLPTDTAVNAVITGISRQLVHMIDGIWEMRKQAKYLEVSAALPSAEPALLRYLQRKFKPYQSRPTADPESFYGVLEASSIAHHWCTRRFQTL